jgi:TIR domain
MTTTANPPAPLDVFYSYAHEDKGLVKDLIASLGLLRQQRVINNLFDCEIIPGQDWDSVIRQQLDRAQIILLCVSSDFLNSDYIYGVELQAALDKHRDGTATVIPVILRSVDWSGAPFAELQALPQGARAVTSWPNVDEAFTDVAMGVRRAIRARAATPSS